MTTPIKTPMSKSSHSASRRPAASSDDSKTRFDAYNRLQAAAVAFGEKLPIPEIVVLGGQSDGKSSLLEALLGFRFNVRDVEMGTRRPLVLQMVHDPSALEPRCRFQEEDSEEYGSPIVLASAIADLIRERTEAHLKIIQASVSSKPIVMRAEYAHCPNLTIVDTPGFILKAKKGEPENTPNEILSMVKSLASPPHRLLLFLQQSSVEWCSSLWLDSIRDIDPTFKRTIIVVSKFDNRLKEFTERWEVDNYLSASGYLGDNTHPYFVALPKDRGTVTNDEFRRQISQVDIEIQRHLRENIKGGFNEEKYGAYLGFNRLKEYLETELQNRYREAAPATLALLEQRCIEVSMDLSRVDSKLKATSDVSHLRRSAMLYADSICSHVGALIDGAAYPAPEQWGKSTSEEQLESGIRSWPGVTVTVKPPNCTLKLYGGAAFERVMHEFKCATYSIECPQVSREKVANILLAHAGRGASGGLSEAAAEIARAAARAWLAPLLDTACERLCFVLKNLFDLAMERSHGRDTAYQQENGDMDGYIGFHAALRRSYNNFIHNLSKQCKQLVRHHLDSATSPYSNVCYTSDILADNSSRFSQHPSATFFPDLSDISMDENLDENQENIPPNNQQHTTPAKDDKPKEALKENQLTIPETPSPDQYGDLFGVNKKENDHLLDRGGRKRKENDNLGDYAGRKRQKSNLKFDGRIISRNQTSNSGSSYAEICSLSAQHFSRIREVLIERNVPSALSAGFLTPCRKKLSVAISIDLFATNDEKFKDMFVAPGAVDVLQSERQSLHKRQKILQTCLNEFKNIARAL